MKIPAKIYVVQQSIKLSPSKSLAVLSNIKGINEEDTEYIRRDVVGRAMWRLMADWKHFITADTIDKYINDAIEDANNDPKGVAK